MHPEVHCDKIIPDGVRFLSGELVVEVFWCLKEPVIPGRDEVASYDAQLRI
jgi:hypothetical protein